MEFELTYSETQQRFRAEVREWLEANVPPELKNCPEYQVQTPEEYALRRQLGRALGEQHWLYPGAPREYGGGGYDIDSLIVLEEESHRLGLTLPPYYDSGGRLGSVTILAWGVRGAETPVPAAHLHRRGPDVAAALRAQRRFGPGQREDHGHP